MNCNPVERQQNPGLTAKDGIGWQVTFRYKVTCGVVNQVSKSAGLLEDLRKLVKATSSSHDCASATIPGSRSPSSPACACSNATHALLTVPVPMSIADMAPDNK